MLRCRIASEAHEQFIFSRATGGKEGSMTLRQRAWHNEFNAAEPPEDMYAVCSWALHHTPCWNNTRMRSLQVLVPIR